MRRMSAKISVIIPFYNGAAYLPECVTSVLNQTYANLEVILVDDGSTDASSRQAEEFRQRDQRVRVLHKANGGPVTVAMHGWPWPRGNTWPLSITMIAWSRPVLPN